MSAHLAQFALVMWVVAFAATMGWAAGLWGSRDQDWYDESTWGT